MHRIVAKEQLSDEIFRMDIEAPLIAAARQAGQFLILQVDEHWGERIPLTIAGADPAAGTVTVVFQSVGRTTHLLAAKAVGDRVPAVLGPLGHPTHIEKFGTVACVGGGIGIAPLYPIAQAMKAAGNRLIVIVGARNRSLIVMADEMRRIADEFIIVTDDGSAGQKGLVTAPLDALCRRTPPPDCVVAIGPPIMMKCCAETTRPFGVKTVVSLNAIMIDGTGMCGGCRVTVGGNTRFVCVDGPEFDGHQVDFDNLIKRLRAYKSREDADHHRCHLDQQVKP